MRLPIHLLLLGSLSMAAEPQAEPAAVRSGESAWQHAERMEAIERSMERGTQQQRLAVLNDLARHPETGLERALDNVLRDSDPVILAAAINVVARSWPTTDHHLARVRQEAASTEPGVALAAIGALGAIGDDARTELIASRLGSHADASVAASAHAALVRLTGMDAGADEAAWRESLAAQRKTVEPQLERLREAMSSGDAGRIRQSMHQMLMLKGARSERAQLLAELSGHPDPAIRRLAADGLANIGGGVAALVLANGSRDVRDSVIAAAAKPSAKSVTAAPAATAGGTPWGVIAIVVGSSISAIGWMLFRSPAQKSEALQKATRSFRRAMVRNGDARRLAEARAKFGETGLFRRK